MSWSFAWLLGPALLALAAASLDEANQYIVERAGNPELKATLTVQEDQGGIAGTNVYRWEVKPSGEWSYAEYQIVKEKERPGSRQEKTGKLTQKELQSLAKQLASQDLVGLPRKLGQEGPVNPHQYTLRFGKEIESKLHGAEPRTDDDLKKNILTAPVKGDAQTTARARFAAIVQAIRDQTTGR